MGASTAAPGAGAGGASAPDGLTGTWTVQSAGSFVGYRVVEQLARIGTSTAVGRTSAVTGTLQFDGSAVTAQTITADLRSLKSDENLRDSTLSRSGLQTSAYPNATFVLTQPIAIPVVPPVDQAFSATANGNFTLHDVTKPVAIPVQGKLTSNGTLVVVGSTNIVFADYNITPPRSMSVLSIEDHGVMEFQLTFTRA